MSFPTMAFRMLGRLGGVAAERRENGTMDISRRRFLEATAASGLGVNVLGFDLMAAQAASRQLKIADAREYRTVCPYCAVGCGAIAYVRGGSDLDPLNGLVHIEGDPDNPINTGTLCPKGAAQMQFAVNPRARRSPLLRERAATEWQEVDWDFAMGWLARQFKDSRDRTFVARDEHGRTVNRCEGLAWVGSASVANEDAYLIAKTMRALGLIYIEHQARI